MNYTCNANDRTKCATCYLSNECYPYSAPNANQPVSSYAIDAILKRNELKPIITECQPYSELWSRYIGVYDALSVMITGILHGDTQEQTAEDIQYLYNEFYQYNPNGLDAYQRGYIAGLIIDAKIIDYEIQPALTPA